MDPDGRLDRIEAIWETLTRRLDGMTQTTELIQAAQLASEKRAGELYEADARARNLIADLTESMKCLPRSLSTTSNELRSWKGVRSNLAANT